MVVMLTHDHTAVRFRSGPWQQEKRCEATEGLGLDVAASGSLKRVSIQCFSLASWRRACRDCVLEEVRGHVPPSCGA